MKHTATPTETPTGMPHIGDKVKLVKGRSKKTARVASYIMDIPGGVVLDGYLDGFRCWNKLDLRIVPEAKRK